MARRCRLFVIDAYRVAEAAGLGRRINTVMQVCFFALGRVLPVEQAIDADQGVDRRNLGQTGAGSRPAKRGGGRCGIGRDCMRFRCRRR